MNNYYKSTTGNYITFLQPQPTKCQKNDLTTRFYGNWQVSTSVNFVNPQIKLKSASTPLVIKNNE